MCRYFNSLVKEANSSHYQVSVTSLLCLFTYLFSDVERLLDDLGVDLTTQVDAFFELRLVIGLLTLCFDVLLDSVDLGLIHDEFLLNVVESVVDVILQDLVLGGVVLHGVVGRLLLDAILVFGNEHSDDFESHLLIRKLSLERSGPRELVCHFIFHASDRFCVLLHFLVNTAFKIFDLLKVLLSCLNFNLKRGCCVLSIIQLSLLEL